MSARRFTFIGVTTGSSSIMRIFPRWRDALGLGADVEIAGRDIPVGAPPAEYRDAVAEIARDQAALGALVTTHKIDVYQAAGDLFDGVDELADLCGEVSCIAKRDGRLLGWAKDPIAAGRSLERVLEPRHFRDGGGEALCMGAGGSGTAIALYLLARRPDGDRPQRVVVTDRSRERLDRLGATLAGLESDSAFELVHVDGMDEHQSLLAQLPPRSLVVNATGMGKDVPGSPVGPAAVFPEQAVVWELNYRGALDFLHQARAQAGARRLLVEDGWIYFIHGWTSVMEEVFQRPIGADELDELARAAEFARPRLDTEKT
jgi:shikimate 5-dehydrogenase